ncbi:MAG: YgfZ/GcvT domain-containing protein [Myxococcota bacterium]
MELLSLEDGARALTETAGVCLLADHAVLRVTGDDARSWLNGQITNDVGQVAPGEATYALVVTLKGRVMTDLWALDRGEEGLDLVLPAARLETVASYLDRFVIMEDVEMEPLQDVRVLSVQGPAAARVMAQVDGGPWWPCARLTEGGGDRLVPADEAPELLVKVGDVARAQGGGPVGEASWELARLRTGIPRMGADFGEGTYPQEAGLKDRAVSFRKGCYQGQEAVVMLEHRGKPPKKLARLTVQADRPPDPGTPIHNGEGRPVGEVTSAVADPDSPGRCPALGYLKRSAPSESEGLHAGDAPVVVRAILGG